MAPRLRALSSDDRPWVAAQLTEHWGSPRVVSRGRVHDGLLLPGLLAEDEGRRVGFLLFDLRAGALEVVAMLAVEPGLGIGTALLDGAMAQARELGLRRLWLVTTNDNLPAQHFYEGRGMTRVAVHRGAVEVSRRLKPQIPLLGLGGVPISDEIEFERCLWD